MRLRSELVRNERQLQQLIEEVKRKPNTLCHHYNAHRHHHHLHPPSPSPSLTIAHHPHRYGAVQLHRVGEANERELSRCLDESVKVNAECVSLREENAELQHKLQLERRRFKSLLAVRNFTQTNDKD